MLTTSDRQRLRDVLARAAELGWLGPGPVDEHIDHGISVAETIRDFGSISPAAVVDLGSGGGVPGLVVALALAPMPVTLLDGSARRCAFLRTAASALADAAEIAVGEGRAETLGRDPQYEGRFGVVTARSFARPPVTAECAARFLSVDGRLVVSEPPNEATAAGRWDHSGLAALGFGDARVSDGHGPRLAVITKRANTESRFPRRVGIPEKRPLW